MSYPDLDLADLQDGQRIDNIGFGGLRLIQRPEEFCYGVDAVVLADFAARHINEKPVDFKRVADLGTGTGIIPLILSHKTEVDGILAVEIQPESYSCLCRNVEINGLEDAIEPCCSDVKLLQQDVKFLSLRGTFDAVVSNPPYMKSGAGLKNSNSAKYIARHETVSDLKDFLETARFLLRPQGELFMIHRPSRLVDILYNCRKNRLEVKTMRFVATDVNSEPSMVMIRAVKNGGAELKIQNPLYIYNSENREYTEEIEHIYEREV